MERKNIEVPITNDLMFKKVISDPEIMQGLLERIFPGQKIEGLQTVINERTIKLPDGTKGIRIDVYGENATSIIAMEMENRAERFGPKRSRYYQTAMDKDQLQEGEPYDKLKKLFVIVFTTRDLMEEDRLIDDYRNRNEDGNILGDERSIIYIYCGGEKGRSEYPELAAFCQYVMGIKTDDEFVKKIDARVKHLNEIGYGRLAMNDEMYEKGIRLGGYELGEFRGKAEGKAEERLEGIRKLYLRIKKFGISDEAALQLVSEDYPNMTQEKIQKILYEPQTQTAFR